MDFYAGHFMQGRFMSDREKTKDPIWPSALVLGIRKAKAANKKMTSGRNLELLFMKEEEENEAKKSSELT